MKELSNHKAQRPEIRSHQAQPARPTPSQDLQQTPSPERQHLPFPLNKPNPNQHLNAKTPTDPLPSPNPWPDHTSNPLRHREAPVNHLLEAVKILQGAISIGRMEKHRSDKEAEELNTVSEGVNYGLQVGSLEL